MKRSFWMLVLLGVTGLIGTGCSMHGRSSVETIGPEQLHLISGSSLTYATPGQLCGATDALGKRVFFREDMGQVVLSDQQRYQSGLTHVH